MNDLRIRVRVNAITGGRTYIPEFRWTFAGDARMGRWTEVKDNLYDDKGEYVDGAYTLKWALRSLEKVAIQLAWHDSHYLNHDGTVSMPNEVVIINEP